MGEFKADRRHLRTLSLIEHGKTEQQACGSPVYFADT